MDHDLKEGDTFTTEEGELLHVVPESKTCWAGDLVCALREGGCARHFVNCSDVILLTPINYITYKLLK